MYLAPVAMLVYGGLTLYALYSFHFNAFVWNVISTPGGMASHTVLVVDGDHGGCAGAYPPYARRYSAWERRKVDFWKCPGVAVGRTEKPRWWLIAVTGRSIRSG
jgi:hypothetical protein